MIRPSVLRRVEVVRHRGRDHVAVPSTLTAMMLRVLGMLHANHMERGW